MGKLQPTTHCCGCFSLLFGVQGVCAINLIVQVLFVSFISSTKPIEMNAGVSISPETQALWGTWFLLGIPVVISAGVGAVYRVEPQLRFYFYYLFATFGICLTMLVMMIFQGQICAAMVSSDVIRTGGALVCGFTDALAIVIIIVLGVVYAYLAFIVWSAAELIQMSFFPELMEYKKREQAQKEALLQEHAAASGAAACGVLGPPVVGGSGAKRKLADEQFQKKMELINGLPEKTDAREVARIIDRPSGLLDV